jgi:hypothetical protein
MAFLVGDKTKNTNLDTIPESYIGGLNFEGVVFIKGWEGGGKVRGSGREGG